MRRKKVLFVINTLGKAGAEVAFMELLRQLEGEEVELFLYVLMGQGEMIRELPKNVRVLNEKYCNASVLCPQGRKNMGKKVMASFFSRGSGLKNLLYLLSNGASMVKKGRVQADKLLWRVVSDGTKLPKETYDLAVAYLEGGSAYFVADHVKARKKAAFIHIDYQLAGYTRKLDRDCYLKFDRIFTVSQEVRERFLEIYPECNHKVAVFHNMLNEEKIRERSLEPGGFTDDFQGVRILTVGRLVYQKGYDLAIETMKLLKDAGYQLRWYVLGEGNLRTSLEKQIEQLGLKSDFVLLGAMENPYPYFRQADLYAHLTRFEGKSIAIQEAQILGKPIIASDCSGNREQINSGVDGILCELKPEKMKEAIAGLLEDRKLAEKYGENAHKRQIAYEKDMNLLLELL